MISKASTIGTVALLLGTSLLGHAQTPAPFILKGKLGKVTGPAQVFMRREGLQKGAITDSAVVRNGAFELRGTVASPTKARLVLVRNGQARPMLTGQADNAVFYLEKGTIVFTSPDSLVNAKVTGSALSTQYQQLATKLKPTTQQLDKLYDEYRAATPEQRKSPQFEKQLDAREEVLEKEKKAIVTAYVKANPQTLVSLDAVKEIAGAIPNYAAVAPLFDLLAPSLKATPDGQDYAATLQALQLVSIGAQAPDFTLYTADGKSVSLASYRGKYVLIDFWAFWCGPCRRENPNVAKVYGEYKDRNFEILGVTLDNESNRDKWLKAIKDDNLTWPQVADLKTGNKNEAVTKYSVKAIPQNFLIDPNGKIVATNLRGEELKTTVARFIP
jgi:peroxiredoxin